MKTLVLAGTFNPSKGSRCEHVDFGWAPIAKTLILAETFDPNRDCNCANDRMRRSSMGIFDSGGRGVGVGGLG